ncbi:MAG: SCO family protein [Paracoccaceae bacterium]
MRRRSPAALALTCAALLASSLAGLDARPARGHEPTPPIAAAPAANRGPFSLVDHHGRAVTDEDFLGSYMLVYFGYTHCPDVCPIDLQVMTEAIDLMGEQGAGVQPVFITVDPGRDTVAVMADYVAAFHPRLIGLTGTPEQVAAAWRTYRVRRMKFFPLNPDDGGDQGHDAPAGGNPGYLVDHSAAFFLVGPDGGGLVQYAHGMPAEEIAADLRQVIAEAPR